MRLGSPAGLVLGLGLGPRRGRLAPLAGELSVSADASTGASNPLGTLTATDAYAGASWLGGSATAGGVMWSIDTSGNLTADDLSPLDVEPVGGTTYVAPIFATDMGDARVRIGITSTPRALVAAFDDVAWWQPSDLSTLYQDTSGTTAVTTDGQNAALVKGKTTNGHDLTVVTDRTAPLYKTNGSQHWLKFNEDLMESVNLHCAGLTPCWVCAAIELTGDPDSSDSQVGGWGSGTFNGRRSINLRLKHEARDNGFEAERNLKDRLAVVSFYTPSGAVDSSDFKARVFSIEQKETSGTAANFAFANSDDVFFLGSYIGVDDPGRGKFNVYEMFVAVGSEPTEAQLNAAENYMLSALGIEQSVERDLSGDLVTLYEEGNSSPLYGPTHPSAIWDETVGKVVAAVQGNDLDPYVMTYDPAGGTVSNAVKVGTNPFGSDNHGAPSIVQRSDGKYIVFFGSHGFLGPSNQSWAISDAANDISSWTEQTELSFPMTYPNPVRVPGTSTIYLFFRDTDTLFNLNVLKSTDDGSTWSGELANNSGIVQGRSETDPAVSDSRIYPWAFEVDSDNNIHVLFTPTLTAIDRKGVNHFIWDTSTETIKDMDGVDYGLQIEETDYDDAANALLVDDTLAQGLQVNLLRMMLDDDDVPHIAYTKEKADGSFSIYYTKWNGSGWSTPEEAVSGVGDIFNACEIYHDANETFVLATVDPSGSVNARGGAIERWDRAAGGTWSYTGTYASVTTAKKRYLCNQPRRVRGRDRTFLFCETDTKVFDYNGFRVDLVDYAE